MAIKTLEIKPLVVASTSAVDFGVEIYNVELENLTDENFQVIRNALYHHHVSSDNLKS